MLNAISPLPGAVPAASAPGRVPSAAAGPADVAEISPPRFWEEMEQLGSLGPTAAATGPIGAVLTATARQGLLECLQRIERGGKRFECGAQAAHRFLLQNPAQFTSLFDMTVTGFPPEVNARLVPSSLQQIRQLDVLYGAGRSVESPQMTAARRSLDELQGRGWQYTNGWNGGASSPYEELMAALFTPNAPRLQKDDVQLRVHDLDQAIALNYFYGSKEDLGLADRVRADAVLKALDDGLVFRDLYTEENRDPAFGYHHRGDDHPFAERPGTGVMLPFDDAAARDYEQFKTRLGLAESIWSNLASSGALKADNGSHWYVEKMVDRVLSSEHTYGMDASVTAVSALVIAEMRRSPQQAPFQVMLHANEWLKEVEKIVSTADEFIACSQALATIIAATPNSVPIQQVVDKTVVMLVKAMAPLPPAAAGVEQEETLVTIGGVQIPRRQS